MTREQTDIIYNRITCDGTGEMTRTRFYTAMNEVEEGILILAKAMTEHLDQDERDEWFDIRLNKLMF